MQIGLSGFVFLFSLHSLQIPPLYIYPLLIVIWWENKLVSFLFIKQKQNVHQPADKKLETRGKID